MLRILRKLFGRKDAFGYTAGDRAIFHYHDGRKWRRGDPLAIQRALVDDAAFNLAIDPGVATVPSVEGVRAAGRTASAVRRAFGVPAFDAGGLTDAECLDLFGMFGEFVRVLTEAVRPLPSSPTLTEASAAGDSITASSAASG
jgi:hypothetical protein